MKSYFSKTFCINDVKQALAAEDTSYKLQKMGARYHVEFEIVPRTGGNAYFMTIIVASKKGSKMYDHLIKGLLFTEVFGFNY